MSDSATPWYIAIGSTIITALSSALTYLFKLRENENSKRIDELKSESSSLKQEVKDIRAQADKCEDDRSKLFAQCQVFEYKVDTLEKSLKSLGVDVQKIDVDGTKYSHRNDQ